jgi:hypothetical protein
MASRITLTAPPPCALPRGGDSDDNERDELQRKLIHSPTAAPAGNEAGGPRDGASATLGVKCRGVPTGHAEPAPGFEPSAMKAPMSRASQLE